jgi:membrane protein
MTALVQMRQTPVHLLRPQVAGELAKRTAKGTVSITRIALQATWLGVVDLFDSSDLTFASSIAYYTLLSLFPFLLLVLSIASRIAIGHSGSSEVALQQLIGSAFPSHFEFLASAVAAFAATPLHLSVLSTGLLLWASMGVFTAVTSAVNHAWGVEQAYGFLKHKLIAFTMLLTAGCLAVVALGLISALQVIDTRWFSNALQQAPLFVELKALLYNYSPTPLFVLVVGLIYYFVPNTKVRIADVWFGAVLAGVLWRVAFAAFAWYLRHQTRMSVDASVSAVIAFLVWIYLSAVILLYGVEVTAAYARLRGSTPDPSEDFAN